MNQPLRVLIAEDDSSAAHLVLRELRKAGFDPDWKRVDSEAGFLGELHANWDIILSDYMMPDFGGPRALELLKESGLDIPFIIISGTVGEEEAVASMKLGATDYLLKDRLARLGPAISQILEQARLRRERKAADAALRESEERFREVVQNIEEVFWMNNLDMSQVLFVSSAYERTWGRTCESLYANPMTWLDAIHPDDRERVQQSANAHISDGSYMEEYRIVRPDGSIRWISDRAFPVRNAAGAIYRIAGVAVDITDRKLAEEAFKKRADELERFHRLSVGRELQMIELKKEINDLARHAGKTPPYDLSFLGALPEATI